MMLDKVVQAIYAHLRDLYRPLEVEILSPTIRLVITIEVPDGSEVSVKTDTVTRDPEHLDDPVEHYFRDYLSDNGRAFYSAAAEAERQFGTGFTLDTIAAVMGRTRQTVQSIHRTSGRTARRWREDYGYDEPPIRLDAEDYTWDDEQDGMRSKYRLPEGVADRLADLPVVQA